MQKNENKPANTPKHLGQHLRYSNKFVGRIKEKDDIRQLLQQHDSLVVVNGMGGIGKTSIAYNLMQEDQNAYQHLIWTNLEIPSYGRKEMLKNTLLYQSRPLHLHLGIAEKLQTAKDTAEKWEILWHRISMLQGKVLWVMDNVRADDVATIKSLPKTCTFLLTSRQELNGIETYKLDELKADDALKLFKTYYKGKNEDDILAQICQTVHFHALSIELLARNLAAIDDMTAQQFLEKLQESLLHHQPQAEVYTAYTQKKMDMYSVLTFAFRLGDMYHIKELHPLLH
ncbi:MAG: NB-ARC domain-containing protein, partial [Chitinophagales bacterium]